MSGRGDPSRGPGRRVWQRVQIGSENEPDQQQQSNQPAPARATAPPLEHQHHQYDAESNNNNHARGRPEYANYAPRRRAHRPPYHAGGGGGGGRNGPQSNPRAPWQPEPGTHQRGGGGGAGFGRGRFRVRTMAANGRSKKKDGQPVKSSKKKDKKDKNNAGTSGVVPSNNRNANPSGTRGKRGGGNAGNPRSNKNPAPFKSRPFALTGVRQLKEAILAVPELAKQPIEACIEQLTSAQFGAGGGGQSVGETNALLGAVIAEVNADIENQNTWQGKKDGRGIDFQLCHGEGLVYDVQFSDERNFKNNSWVQQLEKAVLYFTQAICKLPPLLYPNGKVINKPDSKKADDKNKIPYQLEMQYQILYKSRAQVRVFIFIFQLDESFLAFFL